MSPATLKRFHGRIIGFLSVLIAFALCAPAAFAQDSFQIEIPLARFGHGYTLHFLDSSQPDGFGFEFMSPTATALKPLGSVGGSGNYVLASGSHLELTFSIADFQFSHWWLSDDTTGEFTLTSTAFGIQDLSAAFWSTGSGPGNSDVAPSSIRSLALPASRLQHALAFVLSDGTVYPVTQGPLLGYNVSQPDGSTAFQSYGIFNAWVYPEYWRNQDFSLFDLTTAEQSPLNASDLTAGAWTPTSQTTNVYSATIRVSMAGDPSAFTFHTSSGAMQTVYPFWNVAHSHVKGTNESYDRNLSQN